ncbi:MAG: hypothetical protein LBG48_01650 [Rickettsiales bacterium]|nr:hypothetical protein [Rickettsiales bacterium]
MKCDQGCRIHSISSSGFVCFEYNNGDKDVLSVKLEDSDYGMIYRYKKNSNEEISRKALDEKDLELLRVATEAFEMSNYLEM